MQKVFISNVSNGRWLWSLLCLVTEPLIGIRRNKRMKASTIARPAMASAWNRMARPATAVALLAIVSSAQASVSTAEKAFQKGDYAKAEQQYKQAVAKSPDKQVLQFNHPDAAAYKSGAFDQAARSFARADEDRPDLALQQDDYYNLGNTQYRLGQKTEKANAQETIKTWEQAVQSYDAALQLKSDDADAKYNRDLVKSKLEELKKQEQQNQDQQNPWDKKDQDKKNNQLNQQPNRTPAEQTGKRPVWTNRMKSPASLINRSPIRGKTSRTAPTGKFWR